MAKIQAFLRQHRPAAVLAGVVLVLTAIPALDIFTVLGNSWQGIPPAFTDETFYYARVHAIAEGHLTAGNPYFLEHSDGPALVIFAGEWLNVIPLLAGLPFNAALAVNFIVWSLLFAAALYWLFRQLRVPPWIAVGGTVLLYLQSYAHVWRPVNLQPVYPFFFLFYGALARLIREQNRRNVVLLGFVAGATFYLFAYLWQIVVITLGLLFFYALVRRDRTLAKAALQSGALGALVGLPVPLYALWLSHTSAYFWESVGRLGLVNTHIPMAEVFYSGGWIGVVLALLAVLHWRIRALREDKEFLLLGLFIAVSGLGLWIMQGSNLFTGKLLETGEHVRLLIFPWLTWSTIGIGACVWERRAQLSGAFRAFSAGILSLLILVSAYYTYNYFSPFLPATVDRVAWQTDQLYAKPFAWLDQNEKKPVVVWSDPHDPLTTYLPIMTKHFVLYDWAGMMELVPEGEVRERYLVSQYFNNPTVADLRSDREMALYLGRHDFPHEAKTIEREVKVCRMLFFWDKRKDCGTVPTPQSLLGEKFFTDLENRFQTDIKPNIKAYLAKYHVAYILKDKILDPAYHPEMLGAKLVYADDRFEMYHL
ncbi:MAG: DUF2029 domain-containing protein [Patescibacteria group bacterium]|nr:DUF2029 domain-containing protein [Patescibacteria group bacterium]